MAIYYNAQGPMLLLSVARSPFCQAAVIRSNLILSRHVQLDFYSRHPVGLGERKIRGRVLFFAELLVTDLTHQ